MNETPPHSDTLGGRARALRHYFTTCEKYRLYGLPVS